MYITAHIFWFKFMLLSGNSYQNEIKIINFVVQYLMCTGNINSICCFPASLPQNSIKLGNPSQVGKHSAEIGS